MPEITRNVNELSANNAHRYVHREREFPDANQVGLPLSSLTKNANFQLVDNCRSNMAVTNKLLRYDIDDRRVDGRTFRIREK